MSTDPKSDVKEIARAVGAKAREAEEKYAEPEKEPAPVVFTREELIQAVQDGDYGLGQLGVKALGGKFVHSAGDGRMLQYSKELGVFQFDELDQAPVDLRAAVLPQLRQQAVELARQANEETDAATRNGLRRQRDEFNRAAKKLNTLRGQKDILQLATQGKGSLARPSTCFDADQYAIHCRGVVVDLRTGNHRPSRPDDYATRFCDAEWKGWTYESQQWLEFLRASLDNDEDLIDYAQMAFGSAIVAEPQRYIHFLWGSEGWNGKSVAMETIAAIIGDYAYSLPASVLMDNPRGNGSGPTPELAELKGCRLAHASETKRGGQINVPLLKQLTGDDTLTTRRLYKDVEKFSPTHSLFILTNHLPRIGGDEAAFWQRCRIIEFPFSFVDDPDQTNPRQRQRDPDLKTKLLLEENKSGIFAWLVQGALRWQENDKKLPQTRKMRDSLSKYQQNEDSTLLFLNMCCDRVEGNMQEGKPVYDAFTEWFKGQYGENAYMPGKQKFYASVDHHFTKLGPKEDTRLRSIAFRDMQLKEDWKDIIE